MVCYKLQGNKMSKKIPVFLFFGIFLSFNMCILEI